MFPLINKGVGGKLFIATASNIVRHSPHVANRLLYSATSHRTKQTAVLYSGIYGKAPCNRRVSFLPESFINFNAATVGCVAPNYKLPTAHVYLFCKRLKFSHYCLTHLFNA